MTYDEIMEYKEDALTRYDAEEAGNIYMATVHHPTAKVLFIRVDEMHDKDDALCQGAAFFPLHQVLEYLESGLVDGKEICINL